MNTQFKLHGVIIFVENCLIVNLLKLKNNNVFHVYSIFAAFKNCNVSSQSQELFKVTVYIYLRPNCLHRSKVTIKYLKRRLVTCIPWVWGHCYIKYLYFKEFQFKTIYNNLDSVKHTAKPLWKSVKCILWPIIENFENFKTKWFHISPSLGRSLHFIWFMVVLKEANRILLLIHKCREHIF